MRDKLELCCCIASDTLSSNMKYAHCFEAYAAEVYSNLKPSARDLVQIVHKYMADVLWKLTESSFAAFPRL